MDKVKVNKVMFKVVDPRLPKVMYTTRDKNTGAAISPEEEARVEQRDMTPEEAQNALLMYDEMKQKYLRDMLGD